MQWLKQTFPLRCRRTHNAPEIRTLTMPQNRRMKNLLRLPINGCSLRIRSESCICLWILDSHKKVSLSAVLACKCFLRAGNLMNNA